jgi:hypothetical protein
MKKMIYLNEQKNGTVLYMDYKEDNMIRNKYLIQILVFLFLASFIIITCKQDTGTDPDNGNGQNNQESSILLQKYTQGEDADQTPGPALNPEQAVTWKYLVENTGEVTLDSVRISDNIEGYVGTLYNLLTGEKDSLEKEGISIQVGQYTNIGTADGYTSAGMKTDTDSSNYNIHALCGTWELTLIKLRIDLSPFGYPNEMTPEEADIFMTITANADGTFESEETIDGVTTNGNGTWSTEGNILTLTYEGSEEVTGPYTVNTTTLELNITIPYEILPGQSLDIPVTLVFTKQ